MRSGGVFGPPMIAETAGGEGNLQGTRLGMPFQTRGGSRRASKWETLADVLGDLAPPP